MAKIIFMCSKWCIEQNTMKKMEKSYTYQTQSLFIGFKKVTLQEKVTQATQCKRFMQARSSFTHVATKVGRHTITPYTSNIRHYPGEFKGRRYDKLTPDEERRLNLTQHETSHSNIEEVATRRVVMIATSSQGKNYPKGSFHRISSDKINGSYTPLCNSTTKKPCMDDYGFTIPSPYKGGQYVAILETPRTVEKDVEHKCPAVPEMQEYLDKHEDKLKELLKQAASNNKLSRKIGGQDDE